MRTANDVLIMSRHESAREAPLRPLIGVSASPTVQIEGCSHCRVEDAEYRAPLALRAVVIAACAAGGAAIAWALDAGLGAAAHSFHSGAVDVRASDMS